MDIKDFKWFAHCSNLFYQFGQKGWNCRICQRFINQLFKATFRRQICQSSWTILVYINENASKLENKTLIKYETVSFVYEDEERNHPCSAKFKTKDIELWINRHKLYYNQDEVNWDHTKPLYSQMKFEKGLHTQLVVKFYNTTNLVFAQSKDLVRWASEDIDKMKMMIKDHLWKNLWEKQTVE